VAVDPAPGKSGFLYRVESVRGLAALCVAIAHTLGYLAVNEGMGRALFDQTSVRDVVLKIVSALISGETAVVVFFVISGVVIGRSLDGHGGGGSSLREFVPFMIRRVLRLYPAHIVTILGIVVLAALFLMGRPPIDFSAFPGTYPAASADAADWLDGRTFNPLKWTSVAGNLAMASWSMNLVVWSLYCEICAAPFLPLFHRLARRGNGWIDACVLAVLVALSLLTWEHLWSRYLYVFYLGMMVETHGLAWARAVERWLGGPRTALGVVYFLMVLPNMLAADRSPAVILVEALGAVRRHLPGGALRGRPALALLQRPLLRWNGRLSYSFYLWHFFLMTIAVRGIYSTQSAEYLHRFEVPIFLAVAMVTIGPARSRWRNSPTPSSRYRPCRVGPAPWPAAGGRSPARWTGPGPAREIRSI
jgi:peptidoglycan/LPS O-acetylase OafA/YrhL